MKESKYPMYEDLKKYFENTPKEQLDADWKELKHWNEIGTDVFEYINFVSKNFKVKHNE